MGAYLPEICCAKPSAGAFPSAIRNAFDRLRRHTVSSSLPRGHGRTSRLVAPPSVSFIVVSVLCRSSVGVRSACRRVCKLREHDGGVCLSVYRVESMVSVFWRPWRRAQLWRHSITAKAVNTYHPCTKSMRRLILMISVIVTLCRPII